MKACPVPNQDSRKYLATPVKIVMATARDLELRISWTSLEPTALDLIGERYSTCQIQYTRAS